MKPDQNERLRSLITEAIDRCTSIPSGECILAPSLLPGDLFVLRVPKPIAVKWCAVFRHSRDQDLWYVVPGDEFSLVGTADIAIPEYSESGPLNFRCGFGLWMHVNDLPLENRIGRIDVFHVEHIRDHLARIAENRLSTAEALLDVDDDPDYEEWIMQVEAAVEALDAQLISDQDKSPFTVYLASQATTAWVRVAGLPVESLAADTAGAPAEVTPGLRITHDGKGEFVALIDATGVVLLQFNSEDLPPNVFVGEFTRESVDWKRVQNYFSTRPIKWQDGTVYLRIGSRKLVIQS